MTTQLDQAMSEVLQMVASPDEIKTLVTLFDDMSQGHVASWYIDFIFEIIKRLSALIETGVTLSSREVVDA